MISIQPKRRSAVGHKLQQEILNSAPSAPKTFYESTWPDYIFAEIWSRPDLDRRSRYLIAIAGAASEAGCGKQLYGYIEGALQSEYLTVEELREAAVHCSIYNGWQSGEKIDAQTTEAVKALELEDVALSPLCANTRLVSERLASGAEEFDLVMTFAGPPAVTPYFEAGILNFVFGEVWHRPPLSQRDRRWITLVGVCNSSAENPIKTHIYGAMASGNCSVVEMQEFVLQYAVHGGWPKASFAQSAVMEMAKMIEKNFTWDGVPKNTES